ncbi:hypothetical protein D9M68_688500 [compost metagenome]
MRIGQVIEELVELFAQRRVELALPRQIGDGGGDIARLVADLLDHQPQAQRGLRQAQDARHGHLPYAGRPGSSGDVLGDFVQIDPVRALALVLLVPALEGARFQVDGASLHVHDLDEQGRHMGMLENVPVAADGKRHLGIQVQWAENGLE